MISALHCCCWHHTLVSLSAYRILIRGRRFYCRKCTKVVCVRVYCVARSRKAAPSHVMTATGDLSTASAHRSEVRVREPRFRRYLGSRENHVRRFPVRRLSRDESGRTPRKLTGLPGAIFSAGAQLYRTWVSSLGAVPSLGPCAESN